MYPIHMVNDSAKVYVRDTLIDLVTIDHKGANLH